jgi:hypothetical protein
VPDLRHWAIDEFLFLIALVILASFIATEGQA